MRYDTSSRTLFSEPFLCGPPLRLGRAVWCATVAGFDFSIRAIGFSARAIEFSSPGVGGERPQVGEDGTGLSARRPWGGGVPGRV